MQCRKRTSVLVDILLGVQLFAGVQLVFDQQSKNEPYKFTRCKRECSFVLMFGYFSIFFGIKISVFRDMLPDAVSRFAQIIAQIRIPRLFEILLSSEIKSPESPFQASTNRHTLQVHRMSGTQLCRLFRIEFRMPISGPISRNGLKDKQGIRVHSIDALLNRLFYQFYFF